MKKIFSKKWLLVFSIIIGISYGVVWACGWSEWDEYGVSAYTPEAFVDNAYKPFFYSDQFYYEIGHDNTHVSRFNEDIVLEWKQYLGVSNADTTVSYFLLKARAGLIDSVRNLNAKLLPSSIALMPLVKEKKDKKIADFFEFLAYAKANESYAATSFQYWDYDEKDALKSLSTQQLNDRVGMEKRMKVSDLFIAQRYFFQIVRSYFFGGSYDKCITFHEDNKSKFPTNTLATRTLSYVAGCYYKQKNYAQANYLFSKIYDAGTEFKTVAHFSFHPQNEQDWKETLARCKNKEEQVTLWHLLGIYFDEERSIKEIYALQPESEKLELLLARLINIQEIKSNTQRAEYMGGNYSLSKDSLSKNALALVERIADAGNTSKPYMWLISAGYLHFINEDYAIAKRYFEKAEKSIPNDKLVQAQLRLFIVMNRVASIKKLDQSAEELLLPDLVWLQKSAVDQTPTLRYAYAYEWIKTKMALQYTKQNEYLRSELFQHQDTFFTNPLMVQKLKSFMLATAPSAFDKYSTSIYSISISDISEFQYVVLAYQDKIDEALQLSEKLASEGSELLGNPFNSNINDCHDCDHALAQKVKYTKISFLRKMKEMKDNIDIGKEVYSNALLLGNAYYNMSHYGNARFFYEGTVMGTSQYSPSVISNSFRKLVTDQTIAKKYYLKALAEATSEEQKAKITFFLLKCDRNEMYNKAYNNNELDGWDYADIPAINYALLFPFAHTKYYNNIINECGYFNTYVTQHK